MSTEHPNDLPSLAALVALMAALFFLQRRNPRIAIGSWLLVLALILASKISWYFAWFGMPSYTVAHTFRLCMDLLVGVVLLIFTGRPLSRSARSLLILFWNALPFIGLMILYGLGISNPIAYVVCAATGSVVSVTLALRLKRIWAIPVMQVTIWAAIAAFGVHGNGRAAAYLGLAAVYGAAALHVWFRLRKGNLGRIGIVASLSLWAVMFLTHPWVLNAPRFQTLNDEIWNMQKYVVIVAMLIFLLEEELREKAQLAFHDQLTGLPNRRLMEKHLLTTMADGRATVLLIDVDGFEAINDSLGHLAGDEILRHVATRFASILTLEETLVRLGGDEFLIISKQDPVPLKASITTSLLEPMNVEGGIMVAVRASVGSAAFPEDAKGTTGQDAISHLLRAADHRMYALKHNLRPGPAQGPA